MAQHTRGVIYPYPDHGLKSLDIIVQWEFGTCIKGTFIFPYTPFTRGSIAIYSKHNYPQLKQHPQPEKIQFTRTEINWLIKICASSYSKCVPHLSVPPLGGAASKRWKCAERSLSLGNPVNVLLQQSFTPLTCAKSVWKGKSVTRGAKR